jgi:hypothetical protein
MMQVEDRVVVQAGRAAKSALTIWCNGQFSRQRGLFDDLFQDLLLWYCSRPETRRKMAGLTDAEVFVTFKKHASQELSGQQLADNVYLDKVMFSTDSVKRFLKGNSTNKYLAEVIPLALDNINELHKEAILVRYVDGIIPKQGKDAEFLSHSLKRLTEEVNVIQLTTDQETIGSRSVIFPDTVKPQGSHGDSTAGIALTLMEQRPDVKDEYLYESPWEQINQGAAAEPVIEFGPSKRFRLTAEEAKLFRRVPGLIELFIEQKQKEWGRV